MRRRGRRATRAIDETEYDLLLSILGFGSKIKEKNGDGLGRVVTRQVANASTSIIQAVLRDTDHSS